jgi:hypothetical protein
MVAYQAETDLVRRIGPHYRRADDEARTLVQSMLANAGDIAVTETELRVSSRPSVRRTGPPRSPRCVPSSTRSRRASQAPACASATPSPPRNRTLTRGVGQEIWTHLGTTATRFAARRERSLVTRRPAST